MITVQPINPRLRFLVDRIESQIARDYTSRNDQNGNGTVDRSEFTGSSGIFDQLDQNRNSSLELSEVKRYVDLLGQREQIPTSEETTERTQSTQTRSFSISAHAWLTNSIRAHFSEEVSNLDTDANGFLDAEELGGTAEEFSALDADQNNLVSAREWSEGFVTNNTEIQMVIKAYQYSGGIFQGDGGTIHMSV